MQGGGSDWLERGVPMVRLFRAPRVENEDAVKAVSGISHFRSGKRCLILCDFCGLDFTWILSRNCREAYL